jgi:SAM-dependent methyltransferase
MPFSVSEEGSGRGWPKRIRCAKTRSMNQPIAIPEHLARGHASVKGGKSASDSAREIGARFMQTVIKDGGIKPGDRILDIGCGPGRMAIALAEAMGGDLNYLGFDINGDDIAFCRSDITSAYPTFWFEQIDVRNDYYNPTGAIDPLAARFPTDDASIDFALAASVFTHMFTDETLRYFAECARVIRPGGTLFATFFLLDDAVLARKEQWKRPFPGFTPIDEYAFTATPHAPGKVVAYRTEFIREALERAGFTIETHYPGAWSGAPGAKHSQDDIVARRR